MDEEKRTLTEDDTFNRLCRPSVHEMVSMYQQWHMDNYPGMRDTRTNLEFARVHNWDWLEFLIAKKAAGYVP